MVVTLTMQNLTLTLTIIKVEKFVVVTLTVHNLIVTSTATIIEVMHQVVVSLIVQTLTVVSTVTLTVQNVIVMSMSTMKILFSTGDMPLAF